MTNQKSFNKEKELIKKPCVDPITGKDVYEDAIQVYSKKNEDYFSIVSPKVHENRFKYFLKSIGYESYINLDKLEQATTTNNTPIQGLYISNNILLNYDSKGYFRHAIIIINQNLIYINSKIYSRNCDITYIDINNDLYVKCDPDVEFAAFCHNLDNIQVGFDSYKLTIKTPIDYHEFSYKNGFAILSKTFEFLSKRLFVYE